MASPSVQGPHAPAPPTMEDAPIAGNNDPPYTDTSWSDWAEEFADLLEEDDPQVPDGEGWTKLAETLRQCDKDKIAGYKEDIDTLLVFAGLFSAITTAFVISASSLLQQDPAATSVSILLHISQQLSSFSVNPTFVNTTFPPFLAPTISFTPLSAAVRVNALWYSSLVCALLSASLSMLVKQWLREYLIMDAFSAQEFCRVRSFRRKGLYKYRVYDIASFLPILLQISLLLFLIGLVEFIRPIYAPIAWIIATLVIIWALFYLCSTLAPILSPSCPYRTPFLISIFRDTRHIIRPVLTRLFRVLGWHLPVDEEADIRKTDNQDEEILLDVSTELKDGEIFDTIRRCLRSVSSPEWVLKKMIEQRLGCSIEEWWESKPDSSEEPRELFAPHERSDMAQTIGAVLKNTLRKCYRNKNPLYWDHIENPFTLLWYLNDPSYSRFVEALLSLPSTSSITDKMRIGGITTMERAPFDLGLIGWAAWAYQAIQRHCPLPVRRPLIGVVSIQTMTRTIRAAGHILKLKRSRDDRVSTWQTVCDYICATEPDELRKLDPATLRPLVASVMEETEEDVKDDTTTLMTAHPSETRHVERAHLYNEVLRSSFNLSKRIPGGIHKALLEKVEMRCLESFRAAMEYQGYYLTDWDKITRERVNLEPRNFDTVGGLTIERDTARSQSFRHWHPMRGRVTVVPLPTSRQPTRDELWEIGLGNAEIRPPDISDDTWMVKRYYSSYHERLAAILQLRNSDNSTVDRFGMVGGGVIQKSKADT